MEKHHSETRVPDKTPAQARAEAKAVAEAQVVEVEAEVTQPPVKAVKGKKGK